MTASSSDFLDGSAAGHERAFHIRRISFSEEDKFAIRAYLDKNVALNSFFGRETELAEYEELLRDFFGRKYCILLNSGTSALHAAYFSLGLGPGDEVIVPTYTHHATVMPLVQLGCAIRFADCSPDTGNIDPSHVAQIIGAKSRAIVVTHQWGHPVEAQKLRALANEHKLLLVEDLSLAVGSHISGNLVGTFGDAACFSLGSSKMFSGGQGGAVLFDDDNFYERANLFGHFGQRCFEEVQSPLHRQYVDTGWGLNLRMHVIAVVVSMARFKRREMLISLRHERYCRLSDGLSGHPFLRPPVTREGCFRGQWQGYCVTVDSLDPVINAGLVGEALRNEGLQVTSGGYQRPLHTFSAFRSKRSYLYPKKPPIEGWQSYRVGDLPIAERVYQHSLGFPLFLDEPLELIDKYVEACWRVAEKLRPLRASATAL